MNGDWMALVASSKWGIQFGLSHDELGLRNCLCVDALIGKTFAALNPFVELKKHLTLKHTQALLSM